MEKTYQHNISETSIYELWQKNNCFDPDAVFKIRAKSKIKNLDRTYTVLMPPPNANAPLHCGHATYAIQDLMIRYKRMQGYQSLYLPGTDHAGFETQVVYERNLQKDGKSRFDFDRETFYNDVLNFVKQNSGIAIAQLKRLGMSADWSKLTFTLDPDAIALVYDTFIKLYKDKLIYRSGYMVNYSTYYGTTFSDLETEYKDAITPLYYVKYKLVDSDQAITVATVRPETIYADVAIAVNPKDKRYKEFVNKLAINPLTDKQIPIITDEYVDMQFGTGALKITPGHDINDFKIGQKHNLDIISLINLDGKMNQNALQCQGLFPKQARIKSVEILGAKDAILKVDEKYQNRILVDYKDGYPIEPMILPNWFVDMSKLSNLAVEAIEKNEVKFNLPMWKRDTLRWIKEKKPWPISRQTVFGIRIPVWYSVKDNPAMQITFLNHKKELVKGRIDELQKTYDLGEIKNGLQRVLAPLDAKYVVAVDAPGDEYIPETDTFDTWFSSGQWPFTTTRYPNGELFQKYFPTDLLDSAHEIMFFWIARMIVFSKYLTGKVPFRMVYFHGIITDKFGKKMSKSKGNVVNPIEMVDKYGADALRMGILVGGNTESKFTPFDENQIKGYRNFANKIWNIARFIKLKELEQSNKPEIKINAKTKTETKDKITTEAMQKFASDLNSKESLDLQDPQNLRMYNDTMVLIKQVTKDLERLKFKFAGDAIYHFIWDRLANDYLEKTKDKNDVETQYILKHSFIVALKLLHPFMPFVTEAVWQEFKTTNDPDLICQAWPSVN